jgi:hypothetical protein
MVGSEIADLLKRFVDIVFPLPVESDISEESQDVWAEFGEIEANEFLTNQSGDLDLNLAVSDTRLAVTDTEVAIPVFERRGNPYTIRHFREVLCSRIR